MKHEQNKCMAPGPTLWSLCVQKEKELLPRGSAMGVSEYNGPHTHPDSVYKALAGPELSMFNA